MLRMPSRVVLPRIHVFFPAYPALLSWSEDEVIYHLSDLGRESIKVPSPFELGAAPDSGSFAWCFRLEVSEIWIVSLGSAVMSLVVVLKRDEPIGVKALVVGKKSCVQ